VTTTPPADFDDFFGQTFPRVRALAILLSGDTYDADDAVQNAYIEALQRWDRVRGYDDPRAWVILVMKQRLGRLARERRRQETMALRLPMPAVAGPEQTAEAREVLAALATLPRPQRTALVLYSLHGHPHQEIAEMLGLRAVTVRVSVHRARQALRHRLGTLPARDAEPREPLVTAGPPVAAGSVVHALRTAEGWLGEVCRADVHAFARARDAVAARAGVHEGTPP
jgi:RNA polymerase sigma factor (sigma-70 family)